MIVPGPSATGSWRNPRWRGLTCFDCGEAHAIDLPASVCEHCGLPLRVDYDLAAPPARAVLDGRPASLWRYREVRPIAPESAVSLVEGWTPLVEVGAGVFVKDEARNPTGSFKSRGMAIAVSERAMDEATRALARRSGLDICPEGGAAWAALLELRASGWIQPGARVVVFNTGNGLKYR